MAKNIEININTGSSYETLYPVTDYNQLLNKPTIPTVPSLPLSIANGGHASTTASGGVYNLVNPLSTRSASQLNSYASSTYIPCTYSTGGYKFPLNNILNYIQNNISVNGGVLYKIGSRTGTGTSNFSFITGLSNILMFAYRERGEKENLYGRYYNLGDNAYYNFGGQYSFLVFNMPNSEGSNLYFAANTISTMTWRNQIQYMITYNGGTISISISGEPTSTNSKNYDWSNSNRTTYYWFALGY